MKIPPVKKPSAEMLAKVHGLGGKRGLIAAIEPESGKYFLGKTLLEALKKARARYPDRLFDSVSIGSPYAHEHKGGITWL